MKHKIVNRNQWLAARVKLLVAEKELTHKSDEVAKRRMELPWVRVEKKYQFQTDDGKASLKDLFRGRSQLLVYHFMFGPDYTGGCPACSAIADGFNGVTVHLANHDVMLWAVSRAPLPKLKAYQRRLGWSFPWASSANSDFNADFNVYFNEMQQREGQVNYNYEREKPLTPKREPLAGKTVRQWKKNDEQGTVADVAAMTGTDMATFTRERPGMSAFILDKGVIYHTYSTYARGLDGLWNIYQWLDRATLGRNETSFWFRRNDEYGKAKKI